MNKDLNKNMESHFVNPYTNSNTNIVIKKDKDKFRRFTVIHNFIDFIVKKIYLINDHLDLDLEIGAETE
jgi:hypothetical protein